MIRIIKAEECDCEDLAYLATEAFTAQKSGKEHLPDGVDDPDVHLSFIRNCNYYKIVNNSFLIGGICLIEQARDHMEVGIIYLSPDMQSKGIGRDVLLVMEATFPHVKQWTLDTGCNDYQNQHFYEKLDYKRVGTTDPESDGYYKILYKKTMDV